MVVCPKNKRDKETLLTIIKDKVHPGTKVETYHHIESCVIILQIITDGWAAYKTLPAQGYQWDSVNHSENFVKPGDSTVHTNSIEGNMLFMSFL